MLIFLTAGQGAKTVDENAFRPTAVYIAAKEVCRGTTGQHIEAGDVAIVAAAGALRLKQKISAKGLD